MVLFYLIIGLTVFISANSFNKENIIQKYVYTPYLVKYHKQYYRMISHVFFHADFTHLMFNMFSLFFLGEVLIKSFIGYYGSSTGMVHFAILYFIGGVFATLLPYFKNQDNSNYSSLGASGSVSAVVFGAILWLPNMQLGLLFFPFPIPAYIFGPLFLAFEYFALRRGRGNIAHDAHIGGALFGILYILLIAPEKGMNFLEIISL
tara:strand:+ start:411 stop:1025 length:615 start_codon:yes stop_codon:yes gene_type:complete